MKVILNFTIVPIDVGLSLSRYVAATERILEEKGLSFQLHANGTNVEGEWEDVLSAMKRCHEVIHEMGAKRIFTSAQFGTRTDRDQSMADKVESVRDKLQHDQ